MNGRDPCAKGYKVGIGRYFSVVHGLNFSMCSVVPSYCSKLLFHCLQEWVMAHYRWMWWKLQLRLWMNKIPWCFVGVSCLAMIRVWSLIFFTFTLPCINYIVQSAFTLAAFYCILNSPRSGLIIFLYQFPPANSF